MQFSQAPATVPLPLLVPGSQRQEPQLSPLGPFDHVVFLFPHHGAGIKSEDHSVQRSRELLLAFFSSVPEVLAPGGQVHVTVKTGMPYEKVRRWGRAPIALRARAAHAEFHSDASLASRTWRTRTPRRTRSLALHAARRLHTTH